MARPALQAQSDERLLALARRGSGPAFEAYVRRYRKPLIAYAAKMVGADRAEDVVQQTFIKALDALKTRDGAEPAKPWLYTVTHNLSVNVLKKKANQYDELAEEHVDNVGTEETVADKQRFSKLVSAIGVLPDKERQIVVQREFEQRSLEQIAADLDSSPTAVNQMLYRARKKLRDACGALVPIPILLWLLRDRPITAVSSTRVATLVGKPVGRITALKFAVAALAVGTAAISGAVFLGGSGNSGGSKGVSDTVAQVGSATDGASGTGSVARSGRSSKSPTAVDPTQTDAPITSFPVAEGTAPGDSGDAPRSERKKDPARRDSDKDSDDTKKQPAGSTTDSPGGGSSSGTTSGGGGSGGGGADEGGPISEDASDMNTAMSASGRSIIVWSERGTSPEQTFIKARWSNGTLSSRSSHERASVDSTIAVLADRAPLVNSLDSAINDHGVAVLAWTDQSSETIDDTLKVAVSSEDGSFGAPEIVSTEISGSFPEVGVDQSGNVLVAWREAAHTKFATRPAGADQFGAPAELPGSGTQYSAVLASGQGGDVSVAWIDEDENSIMSAGLAGDGSLTTPVELAAIEGSMGFTPLSLSVGEQGELIVGWTELDPPGCDGFSARVAYRPAGGLVQPPQELGCEAGQIVALFSAVSADRAVIAYRTLVGPELSIDWQILERAPGGAIAPMAFADSGSEVLDMVLDPVHGLLVAWRNADGSQVKVSVDRGEGLTPVFDLPAPLNKVRLVAGGENGASALYTDGSGRLSLSRLY